MLLQEPYAVCAAVGERLQADGTCGRSYVMLDSSLVYVMQ